MRIRAVKSLARKYGLPRQAPMYWLIAAFTASEILADPARVRSNLPLLGWIVRARLLVTVCD